MLDEIKEYKQYTFRLDEGSDLPSDHRLRKASFIDNNFSGLPRAMEIIARKCLFPQDADRDDVELDDLKAAESLLKRWCGFADEGSPCGSEGVDNWVPRYMEKLGQGEKAKEVIKKWKKEEGGKKGQFDAVTLFGHSDHKNDRNMVFYERVIAEALRQGPLKRRFLVRKFQEGDGEAADIPFENGSLQALNDKTGKNSKLNVRNRKYILELTAIFLMQNPNGAGSDEWLCANVSLDRVRDWACIDGKDNPSRETVLGWQYKGKPLFAVVPIGESDSLWYMQSAWINDYGWRVVGEAEIDQFEDRCVIYREVPFSNSNSNKHYYPFCTSEFHQSEVLPEPL